MKRRRSEIRRRIYFYGLFYDLELFLQFYLIKVRAKSMVRNYSIFGTCFNLHHLVKSDNSNLYRNNVMYSMDSTKLLNKNCRFICNSKVPLYRSGIVKWVENELKLNFNDIKMLTYVENKTYYYSQKILLHNIVQTSVHIDSKSEIFNLSLTGIMFRSSLEFTIFTENGCNQSDEEQLNHFFFFLRNEPWGYLEQQIGGAAFEEDDEGHSIEDLLLAAASLLFSRSLRFAASLASLIWVLASLVAASSALSFSKYSAASFSFCSLSFTAIRYLLVASRSPLKLFQVPPNRGLVTCKEMSIRSEQFHHSNNESIKVYDIMLYNDVNNSYLDEFTGTGEMIAVLHESLRVLLEELNAVDAGTNMSNLSLWDAAGDACPVTNLLLITAGSIHDFFDNVNFTFSYTYTVKMVKNIGEQGAVTYPLVMIYSQCSCQSVHLTRTSYAGIATLSLRENAYQIRAYSKGCSVISMQVNYDVGIKIFLNVLEIFLNVIANMILILFGENSQCEIVIVRSDQERTFRLTRMLKKLKTLSILNLYSKNI